MADRADGKLVFGCVTDSDNAETRVLLADLCKALSRRSGEHVSVLQARSPEILALAFERGDVDLAWVSPSLLLVAREFADAVPLVSSMREGAHAYHGVLFVRENSDYKSPLELKGKTAAWVATTSAAGYIFPRLELAKFGLDPRSFFGSEFFLDTHGNVARAVLSGRADVGGVYATFEHGDPTRRLVRAPFLNAVPDQRGRVLLATAAIPSDLIVAQSWFSDGLRAKFVTALTELHQEAAAQIPLAQVLGVDCFEAHDPKALAPLRESVESGRELGLL